MFGEEGICYSVAMRPRRYSRRVSEAVVEWNMGQQRFEHISI